MLVVCRFQTQRAKSSATNPKKINGFMAGCLIAVVGLSIWSIMTPE